MPGTGIVLKIPNLKAAATRAAATRADGVANTFGDEGTVQTMHLFVFPVDGNGKKVYLDLTDEKFKDTYAQLPCLDPNDPTKEIYAGATLTEGTDNMTTVEVPMYPGKYKIYLLANLDNYAVNASGSTITIDEDLEESAITNMHLKFDKGPVSPDELPMYCSPSDLKYTTSSGTTTAVSDGVFDILTNDVKSLQADLKFQVAKVRYTVLFNSTKGATEAENGFSYPQFKEDYKLSIESAEVDHVVETTKLTGGDDPDDYTFAGAGKPYTFQFDGNADSNGDKHAGHFKVKYPTDVSGFTEDYPFCNNNSFGGNGNANTTERLSNLPHISAETEWSNQSKRAWQGIVYLPENLNDATDSDNNPVGRTVLALKATVNGNGVSNGDNTYKVPLISGTVDGSTDSKIERGNFYDIRALAKGLHTTDITFEVSEWSVENLVYDLHGPYYLIVDKTKVTLTTGAETEITYTTNAEQIEWSSPKYTTSAGVVVDVFDISVRDGKIVASVGTGIPASELSNIKDNINYSYFHIKAGNINKRIDVKLEDLVPTLTVSPDGITIDVGAEIASGNYNDYFEITVKTNCKQYMISSTDLSTAGGLIYITDENDNPVSLDTPRTPTKGVEKLRLHYTGLNDGKLFWTGGTNDLNLTFSAVDASISNLPDPVDLPVDTRPGSSNYTIYMKSDYGLPHIYVYQCLEFPGWYQKDNYKYANKAIGYKKDGIYFAALEYSFTGKIAFKGWEQQDNKDFLGTFSGDWEEGFYMTDYGTDNTWHAPNDKEGKRYDIYYDFVGKYRQDQTACPSCKNDKPHDWTTNYWGYHQLWPGIVMERVKDDKGNDTKWCKFELTGTATPGKALIMFNDGHTDGSRYPDKGMVGIPLFNYESKVGYIDLTDSGTKQFYSETPKELKPRVPGPEGTQNFRIIWNYGSKSQDVIYVWSLKGIKDDTLKEITHYTGTALSEGSSYYYIDFKADVNTLEFNAIFKTGSGWNSNQSANREGINKEKFDWDKSQNMYIWEVEDDYLK